MPVAASATISGSSRRRPRKTISSVSAIAMTAATSRPPIAPVIWPERSLSTTGKPVTVAVPPVGSANWGIRTASRIQPIARACAAADSEARSRTWMSADRRLGNR